PKRPLPIRILTFLFIASVAYATGFVMTIVTSPEIKELYNPISDAETLSLFTPEPGSAAASLEAQIQTHPLLAKLREDSLLGEARPHLKIPAPMRSTNLTGGTLLGDDMIGIPPIMFVARDGSRMVSFHHVGPALCGHPGIVHGGLLATLLDEGLARCCFPALPHKIGMTASLKVDYKAPCQANQFVVLRAETTKVEGRKAWVRGRLETLVDEDKGETPVVLVEAEALFIEPREAA
ncbi:Thioesterase/thiol ester dehydrase-isomerase, partial [Saccharata proteae CBS 121410]